MGYRPSIYQNGEFIVEFGKFYGYIGGEGLKSLKWLVDSGKLDQEIEDWLAEDEPMQIFSYSPNGPSIMFTADEFREFIKLYEDDINNHDFSDDGIDYDKPFDIFEWCNSKKFKEVYDNDEDVEICWG